MDILIATFDNLFWKESLDSVYETYKNCFQRLDIISILNCNIESKSTAKH